MSEDIDKLPPDKYYLLHRTQILHELQTELLKWSKRRLWWITVLILVVGTVGGIIGGPSAIDAAKVRIKKAAQDSAKREAADILRSSETKALQAAHHAEMSRELILRKAREFEKKLRDEMEILRAERARIDELRETAKLQVTKLSEAIRRLEETSDPGGLTAQERERVLARSRYRVRVYVPYEDDDKQTLSDLAGSLEEIGYKVEEKASTRPLGDRSIEVRYSGNDARERAEEIATRLRNASQLAVVPVQKRSLDPDRINVTWSSYGR